MEGECGRGAFSAKTHNRKRISGRGLRSLIIKYLGYKLGADLKHFCLKWVMVLAAWSGVRKGGYQVLIRQRLNSLHARLWNGCENLCTILHEVPLSL